jgi:hypothetical protein
MNNFSRMVALGLAVANLAVHEAAAQLSAPPAPSKALPRVEASALGSYDPEVVLSSQETSAEAESSAAPLDELAWMVGEWVDQDEDATIESSVAWTKNGKFLRRMFRVTPREGATHAGMQLIGWDPAEETIRSWTYDEDGGFGEERWRRDGDRWTIRTRYTLPDGARGSAVNLMRRIDDDSFTWRSVSRSIGGSIQPDIDEVTVVRRSDARAQGETAESAPTGAPNEEKQP